MGAGHWEEQATIRSLEFSAHPPFSGEGRRAENGVSDPSQLHGEASIKSPKYGVWRASGLLNNPRGGG